MPKPASQSIRADVIQRLQSLGLSGREEFDLAEEIAQHVEDRLRELTAGGTEPREAYQLALADLSDLDALRAGVERNRLIAHHEPIPVGAPAPAALLEGLWKDLRYAVRGMKRSPVFVLFVVLTLAIGIGANTTVFTLINTLILSPLPVQDPARLVAVAAVDPRNTARSSSLFPVAYADLDDYRAQNRVFQSLAAFTSPRGMTLLEHSTPSAIFGELVSSNYFSTLGLTPARGRFFAAEDGVPGAPPVAVLNYAAWQKRFGGDENICGRELRVNNLRVTVIGVAPPHFLGMNAIFGPDIWVPASLAASLFPNTMENLLTDRAKGQFEGVARLQPGVTEDQARASVAAVSEALRQTYPLTNQARSAVVRPVREIILGVNGNTASSTIFAGAALFIVVGIVLLIACSNVANLLLARSSARQQELAVRLAMGASRARLIRQLLTESVLLGLLSGAAGIFVAYQGLQFLFGRLPGGANFPEPRLDLLVLAYALAASLLTGLLFGTIPAWKASRANVADALRDARSAGLGRRRVTIANALLVGQVAFSFLLLITAALFLRSIGRAYAINPGFQTEHLAMFPTNPGQAGLSKEQSENFYRDVRRRVSAIPSVEQVSWSSNMPLWAGSATGFQLEGHAPKSAADQIRAVAIIVDRDYFDVSGISLEAGRAFTELDRDGTLPVAIVNEKLTRDFWPSGAVGRHIRLPGETVSRQVIGVVRTADYTSWGEPQQDAVYTPLAQHFADSMVLYVRTAADPRQIMSVVEREIHASGPGILIFGTRTGSEIIDNGLFQAKMGVGLLTIFGLVALGLASIGLYGVLAYSVNQRRREIGLRMALGASRVAVVRLIVGQGMTLVGIGVVLGMAASLAAGAALSRMLFGIAATDPLSITLATALLSTIALLACYLPARRATQVDPLDSLRQV